MGIPMAHIKYLAPSKICNKPYISDTALTFLNLTGRILPPQHIVANVFSDYPFQKNSTFINLNPSHHPFRSRLPDVTFTLNVRWIIIFGQSIAQTFS